MTNLTETEIWENGVYQIELTDPVVGGADGISNRQAKQLANRTAWLRALLLQHSSSLDVKQPLDATLTALAAQIVAADKLIYATGVDTFSTTTLTAFARTLLDDANAAAALATLGAAPLASPALTGTPTVPTAPAGTSTQQVANTAFVQAAIAALVASSPAALDTLNELAAALGNDPNFATTMTNALATKAPLASPALTGTPTAPTAPDGTLTQQLATTAFVRNAMALFGLGVTGASPSMVDFDDVTIGSGMYYTSSTVVNGPIANAQGFVLHKVYGAGGFQLFCRYGINEMWYRSRSGSTWAAWARVGNDILATVGLAVTNYQPNWPNTSLDDCTGVATGIYRATAGSTGLPAGISTASVLKYTIRDAFSAGVHQVVQELINTAAGRRFTRVAPSNGTPAAPNWGPWREEAYLDSPAFTGIPTAPTAAAGTSTTQLATTAFVATSLAGLVGAAPGALDTLNELAAALGNDPNFATTMTNALAAKAPLASPALTGTPTAPTAAQDTSTSQLATTSFVMSQAATQLEAEAGTVTARWMSPLRVFQAIAKKVVQATEAIVGIAAIATQAQTNAGTDDATIVTPKKLRAGFAISINTNGYIAFPSWMGGLIFQWGRVPIPTGSAEGSASVSLPIAFPTGPILPLAAIGHGGTPATWYGFNAWCSSLGTSTITCVLHTGSTTRTETGYVNYLAIGR